MPVVDVILDGYRLIRLIGSGGFGDVWLCQMESTGEYRALKFIPSNRMAHLSRELQALVSYRQQLGRSQNVSLITVEHINRAEAGLFYVMPVADGPNGIDPTDPAWYPLTLRSAIDARRLSPNWFSLGEIAALMAPIIRGVGQLSDQGLLHRDIKPENILYFRCQPCLSDVGLVTADASDVARHGTPGFVPPDWYEQSGGHPDMYGLAMTLYVLATGNDPSKISRPAYRWPPTGEQSLSVHQRARWLGFMRLILRALAEEPEDRFPTFSSFAVGLEKLGGAPAVDVRPRTRKSRMVLVASIAASIMIVGLCVFFRAQRLRQALDRSSGVTAPTASPQILNRGASPAAPTARPPAVSKLEIPEAMAPGDESYFTPQEYANCADAAFGELDYRVLKGTAGRQVTSAEYAILQAELSSFFWNGKPEARLDLVQAAMKSQPDLKNLPSVQSLEIRLTAEYPLSPGSRRTRARNALEALDRLIKQSDDPLASLTKVRLLLRFANDLPRAAQPNVGLSVKAYAAAAGPLNPIRQTVQSYLDRHPRDFQFVANVGKELAVGGESWAWGAAKEYLEQGEEWADSHPELQKVIAARRAFYSYL